MSPVAPSRTDRCYGHTRTGAGKLRAFGEAGLRHVVLAPVSGLVSRSAATYSSRAIRTIARALAGGVAR